MNADIDEQRRNGQARRAAMAGLLLFSPWQKLRPNIAMATHDPGGYFDEVDEALETGTIAQVLKEGSSMVPALTKLIRAAMIGGYQDGGAMVGLKPGSRLIARAEQQASQRAVEASGQMLKTSKKWLKENPDHAFALSSARADRAAKFEAARGYYGG